ncbi:hypothetical protein [Streptomyces sp. NPDC048551]|uniref:hypothetical protein n=1 Tax=Streptomyces sp. NPDC048551 TaxID=3155758 RepID=UPI003414F60C
MDRTFCKTREHIRLESPLADEPGCVRVSVRDVLRVEWLGLAAWIGVGVVVFLVWHVVGATLVAGVFGMLMAIGFFWNVSKGHSLGCSFLGALASVARVTEFL